MTLLGRLRVGGAVTVRQSLTLSHSLHVMFRPTAGPGTPGTVQVRDRWAPGRAVVVHRHQQATPGPQPAVRTPVSGSSLGRSRIERARRLGDSEARPTGVRIVTRHVTDRAPAGATPVGAPSPGAFGTRVVHAHRRTEVAARPGAVLCERAPVAVEVERALTAAGLRSDVSAAGLRSDVSAAGLRRSDVSAVGPPGARCGPGRAPMAGEHPTVDLDHLTDQIVTRLDSRLTAHRERFGRAF